MHRGLIVCDDIQKMHRMSLRSTYKIYRVRSSQEVTVYLQLPKLSPPNMLHDWYEESTRIFQ